MASPARPTLLEDWLARRVQLYKDRDPNLTAYRDVQIQVLDYLLKRYRDDTQAQRPARFPLPKDVVWNRRAQVVHRHLALHKTGVIRDEEDARSRIGPLLTRMASLNVQADLGPPAHGALGLGEAFKEATEVVERGITKGFPPFRLFRDANASVEKWLEAFHQMLPDRQLELLRGHFRRARHFPEDDDPAGRGGIARPRVSPAVSLEFLKRCGHPDALGYLILLWKGALLEGPNVLLRENLESHFEATREQAAEHVRFELANVDPRIRLGSVRILARIGTLDDIGMLSDLLVLPEQEDEAPGERNALLDALVAISRRNPTSNKGADAPASEPLKP